MALRKSCGVQGYVSSLYTFSLIFLLIILKLERVKQYLRKSMLTELGWMSNICYRSVVINYLQQAFPSEDFGIAFVYCNYKEQKEQTLVNLISSLLGQLVDKASLIPEDLYHLYQRHKKKGIRPSLSEYLKLLHYVVFQFSAVFIVIDALDECSESDGIRERLIDNIYRLLPEIRLFVTSRRLFDIEKNPGLLLI